MSATLKLALLNGEPEIFHTLQGEGISMGVPAVFVRSSLCNLHCQWCDTDYTWNWEGTPWPHEKDGELGYQKFRKDEWVTELSTDEVARRVLQYDCNRVVLTGGEPLLQDTAWVAMMGRLRETSQDMSFEVETNGTKIPSEEFDALASQYNVSPKLANSGNAEQLREQPTALDFFGQSGKAWFKFVIAEDTDLDEVEALIETYQLPKNRILIMPEGRDQATLQQRRLWVADACKSRGFRYSDRLHIQLWGSKRGV
ncbi:MAG: 7-carboxy-7-deazaguanine synthase QueE [Akkermansiaceae bacterium]